jgi:hypothetical protein
MNNKIMEIVQLIDASLAQNGMPIKQRPSEATIQFVTNFCEAIRIGGQPPQAPGALTEFAKEPWFRAIYADVEGWYKSRYGSQMEGRSDTNFRAVMQFARTFFEMNVPQCVISPGVPGKTIWLSFPAEVLSDEDVFNWIRDLPNVDTYSQVALTEACEDAAKVANAIRSISSRLIGTKSVDEISERLLAGIQIHLQGAADRILSQGDRGGYSRAQWELQMALESAFKGLMQQRTGQFTKTHNLFLLFDQTAQFRPAMSRTILQALPNWEQAVDLRYGLGDEPTAHGIFGWYKTTLEIISNIAKGLDGSNLSSVRLEIGKAPWLQDHQIT